MRIRDVISVDEMEWLLKQRDRHWISDRIAVYYYSGPPAAQVPGWYAYDANEDVSGCPVDTLAEVILLATKHAKRTGQKVFGGTKSES